MPYKVQIASSINDSIIRLGCLAGENSRFVLDPNIERSGYQRLYSAWVENCFNGSRAEVVFVAKSALKGTCDEEAAGMLALRAGSCEYHIELLAVSPEHRQRGIAKGASKHEIGVY